MIRLRRHPKKDIEKALAVARKAGWTVIPKSSGHNWGVAYCPATGKRRCRMSIASTPRNPSDVASRLRRIVRQCPHGKQQEVER
jgi:hypothetical protein